MKSIRRIWSQLRGATRVKRQVDKLLDYNKFGLHFRQTLINASILETTSTINDSRWWGRSVVVQWLSHDLSLPARSQRITLAHQPDLTSASERYLILTIGIASYPRGLVNSGIAIRLRYVYIDSTAWVIMDYAPYFTLRLSLISEASWSARPLQD